MSNPYAVKGPAQVWRTAIAERPYQDVEPIRAKRIPLADGGAVATAGSCSYPEIGVHYAIEEPFVWRTGTMKGGEELGPEEFVDRTFAGLTETGGISAGSIPNFDLLAEVLGAGAT